MRQLCWDRYNVLLEACSCSQVLETLSLHSNCHMTASGQVKARLGANALEEQCRCLPVPSQHSADATGCQRLLITSLMHMQFRQACACPGRPDSWSQH